MKTPYNYLVEPVGERYTNVKKIEGKELIVNTTQDETDYKYVNRIGKIIATPKRGGLLQEGDLVIVHHNTFRKWFNVMGELKDSANFVKDNQFHAGPDQIFAFKRDGDWESIDDVCFVEAEKRQGEGFIFNVDKNNISETRGKVYISNPILESQGISKGDRVLFQEQAAYRFDIDGKVLYKMSARLNIQAAL